MTVRQKRKEQSAKLPVGISIGILAAWVMALLLCMLGAYLISKETVSQNAIRILSGASQFLGAGSGALIAAALTQKTRLQVCMITAGGFFMSLLAMTALFFGGQYHSVGLSAFVIFIGGAIAALLGIRPKKGMIFRNAKRRYR